MSRYLILLLILAGCGASPAPEYFGATRHDMTLDGIQFAVFVKGDKAEVIRLGYLSLAERRRVPPLMLQAAEQASGCKVTGPERALYAVLAPGEQSFDILSAKRSPSLPGDTGEARFRLRC